MWRKVLDLTCLVFFMTLATTTLSCEGEAQKLTGQDASSELPTYGVSQQGLASADFKIPLSPDYNWEITQSWAEHCEICNSKGYDEISNGYYGDFCELSHSSSDNGCYSACKYGWDFSLPGPADLGKPVLASSDGIVKKIDAKAISSWGNYVVIDHGNNVCTRYAHLLGNSITVTETQQVCQGLKIGEIGKSGNASGEHLHFQFENCNNLGVGIDHGFTDGNSKPECTMSNDIYTNGVYTALALTNVEKDTCGWSDGYCGELSGCPLSSGCANEGDPPFGDLKQLDSRTKAAATYLWHECVISGKNDGKFHADDSLSRAEALKIALTTFGLMSNCNVSEPFVDVKPSDWFYPYVLCGIKYGIIKTTYSGFFPNQAVTFSEAAKIAVESAKKAGKITTKFPSKGHFPNIPINHWAYKYVETVFFYGGINFSIVTKGANDAMKRGEYAVMVAALSPCFCESVKCDEDCACDQDLYSCEVAYVETDEEPDWLTGGDGDTDDEVDGQTMTACVPKMCFASSLSCGSYPDGCGGILDCGSCPFGTCVNGKCPCQPNCYKKQCGSDGCSGVCGQCQSGTQCEGSVCLCQPNCSNKQCGPNGCGGVCGQCSSGNQCDASGKCVCQPNCSGKQCGSNGCGGFCGQCSSGNQCDANGICKSPPPPPWTCDPAKGYTVYIYSPNGKWEAKVSPGGAYYSGPLPAAGTHLYLQFDCNELPASVLVTGGSSATQIWTQDNTLPVFEVWVPYFGPLVINPSYKADVVATSLYSPSPNSKILIRIPSN